MKLLSVIFTLFIVVSSLSNVIASERSNLLGLEESIASEVADGKPFGYEHCEKLFAAMERPQVSQVSRDITAMVETEANGTFRKIAKDKKQKVKDAIISYVQNSGPHNTDARGGNISELVRVTDYALEEMQKIRVKIAQGWKFKNYSVDARHNVRITYRLGSYPPGIHDWMPYDPPKYNKNISSNNKIKQGDIITDKGFLSTSQNRQYLSDPFDPISQTRLKKNNILVKMVMLGYTGTPIGIDGIKTTNEKIKRNELDHMMESQKKKYKQIMLSNMLKIQMENKGKEKGDQKRMENPNEDDEKRMLREYDLMAKAHFHRAGEGEILYGRGTKWKVLKIDSSSLLSGYPEKEYKNVYVCLRQVKKREGNFKSSFNGEQYWLTDKSKFNQDFTSMWQPVQNIPMV